MVKKMNEKLKGTRTEANLAAAFAGESQARNKYTYFASKAKKDGYVQIANLFEETANNEKEHAKIWFKLLDGIGTTEENLAAAADGENYEWTDMYARFAREAREETISRPNSRWWAGSNASMRRATASSFPTSKAGSCSPATRI